MIFISLLYIILIIWLIIGFDKCDFFYDKPSINKKTYFSIVIPFRNESVNLINLIESLNKLNYNNFELVFIDDASADNSVSIIKQNISKTIDYSILSNIILSKSPKKDAIKLAISKAKYNWIVTTDADCVLPVNWLQAYDAFLVKNDAVFIAAPVDYSTNHSFIQDFQKLDFLSLLGTTIGSFGWNKPFMCNGANLCYAKDAFYAVGGFEDNNHISSGDDVFLMEKMVQHYPNQVFFLKSRNAIVKTKPMNTYSALVNQRIRWASKTGKVSSWFVKLVGVVILLANFIFSVGLLVCCFLYFNHLMFVLVFIIFSLLKLVVDYVLIKKTFLFYNQTFSIIRYLSIAFLHPFFIVGIAILSVFKKFSWKDRVN